MVIKWLDIRVEPSHSWTSDLWSTPNITVHVQKAIYPLRKLDFVSVMFTLGPWSFGLFFHHYRG